MISRLKRFVFIHIPRTGGTSMENFLLAHTEGSGGDLRKVLISPNRNPFRGPPWLTHLTAEEYVRHGYLSADEYASFFKFALVRNPWARLVSEYNAKGPNWRMRYLGLPWNFRNFVLKCFPCPLENNYFHIHDNHRHIIPQTRFLYDGDQELVDLILPIERLPTGWPQLLERLSLPADLPLGRANRSQPRSPEDGRLLLKPEAARDYHAYYTDEEVYEFVTKKYAEDITRFGYSF